MGGKGQVEESKGVGHTVVAETSTGLISGDDTWCFGDGTFKKRVNEGNSCDGPLAV